MQRTDIVKILGVVMLVFGFLWFGSRAIEIVGFDTRPLLGRSLSEIAPNLFFGSLVMFLLSFSVYFFKKPNKQQPSLDS